VRWIAVLAASIGVRAQAAEEARHARPRAATAFEQDKALPAQKAVALR
jgi:hypothetical protein